MLRATTPRKMASTKGLVPTGRVRPRALQPARVASRRLASLASMGSFICGATFGPTPGRGAGPTDHIQMQTKCAIRHPLQAASLRGDWDFLISYQRLSPPAKT